MAIQYYNIQKTGKKYAVDKSTGEVKEVSSIPLGGATINWIGYGLPSALENIGVPSAVRTQPYGMDSQDDNSTIQNGIIDVIDTVVKSGKTFNPDITDEDLADIDIAEFLKQAEAEIAPEYKQKFSQVKDDLVKVFERTNQDLAYKITGIDKQEKADKLAADESFSGRGLTFSSRRENYNQDLADTASQERDRARTLAFRDAQDTATAAERQLGSDYISGISLPSIGGKQVSPVGNTIGSLEREKQYNIEQMSRQLEFDERARRAYTTRSLSFA